MASFTNGSHSVCVCETIRPCVVSEYSFRVYISKKWKISVREPCEIWVSHFYTVCVCVCVCLRVCVSGCVCNCEASVYCLNTAAEFICGRL